MMTRAVGLSKFFRVSCFKLQTWDWSKSWRYTNFQVPPGTFDHVCRAPKVSTTGQQACKCLSFRALQTWSNVSGGTWNLVYLEDLGQSQVWSLKHETPKNLGSPSLQCIKDFRDFLSVSACTGTLSSVSTNGGRSLSGGGSTTTGTCSWKRAAAGSNAGTLTNNYLEAIRKTEKILPCPRQLFW